MIEDFFHLPPVSTALVVHLEQLVCRQLVAHLEDNNLIYEHQNGFQHSESTQHNLIQITNFINTALNDKKYAIGIFLDP
jgi:hypothetical protein